MTKVNSVPYYNPYNSNQSSNGNRRSLIAIGFILILAFFTLRHEVLLAIRMCVIVQEEQNQDNLHQHAIAPSKSKSSSYIKTPVYNGPTTVYSKWNHPFPCLPGDAAWQTVKIQRSPSKTGLLYLREMKTGSSTLAGIILRLAHTRAQQQQQNQKVIPCKLRVDHSSARILRYSKRIRNKSYLISMLREPTKRVISQYFHFQVSEFKHDPTDENFQQFLSNTPKNWNYYTKDLVMNSTLLNTLTKHQRSMARTGVWPTNDLKPIIHNLIRHILSNYDFIAITERMNESLVVFKLLMDLDYQDILYMSAKRHGSFTSGHPQHHPCIYITPSFVTEGMKNFFASDYWNHHLIMGADQLLYQAAIQSLDRTIDSLGRDLVKQQVQVFERVLAHAQTKCHDKTIYRCDSRGTFVGHQNSTCYMWDIGCGYSCLNHLDITDVVRQAERETQIYIK